MNSETIKATLSNAQPITPKMSVPQSIKGEPGKDAYQVAVDNGFVGTEEEWLESLKSTEPGPPGPVGPQGKQGIQGRTGPDGRSAYQVAIDNGFTGTEEEWLESLKGEPGENGKDGASTAAEVSFDDTTAQLGTDNVQTAIEALASRPSGGGGSVDVDNYSIVKNENGQIETAIGGGYVDGKVPGPDIVNFDNNYGNDVTSKLTYDIMMELIACGEDLRANLNSGYGKEEGCLVEIDTSVADTYKLTCYYTIVDWVQCVYTGTGTADNWSCQRTFKGGGTSYNTTGNSFYKMVDGKVLLPLIPEAVPLEKKQFEITDNTIRLVKDFVDLDSDSLTLGYGGRNNSKATSYSLAIGRATGAENYSIAIGFNCFAHKYNINIDGQNSLSAAHAVSIANDYNKIGDKAEYGVTISGNSLSVESPYQWALGRGNLTDAESKYLFIIGNGPERNKKNQSNALSVDWSGNLALAGAVSSAGADYAEFFEWADGNPLGYDRVGYIVTLNGDKIETASDGDDILGITSGTMTVLGDDAQWHWQGKYLKDDFGRTIYEDVEVHYDAEYNELTGELKREASTEIVHRPVMNPAYDPNQPYINRRERPEWSAVGMMGKLYVRDDGTAKVNGYVTAKNGVATASPTKTNMRVMERVSENVIKVCLK